MKWKPIETAPKDGTKILVYGLFAGEIIGTSGEQTIGVAFWDGGRSDYVNFHWKAANTDAYAGWWRPTHWMPLPDPPTTNTPAGRKETE